MVRPRGELKITRSNNLWSHHQFSNLSDSPGEMVGTLTQWSFAAIASHSKLKSFAVPNSSSLPPIFTNNLNQYRCCWFYITLPLFRQRRRSLIHHWGNSLMPTVPTQIFAQFITLMFNQHCELWNQSLEGALSSCHIASMSQLVKKSLALPLRCLNKHA